MGRLCHTYSPEGHIEKIQDRYVNDELIIIRENYMIDDDEGSEDILLTEANLILKTAV